jgi:hypothetical protein
MLRHRDFLVPRTRWQGMDLMYQVVHPAEGFKKSLKLKMEHRTRG